jgi:hypothetical protein
MAGFTRPSVILQAPIVASGDFLDFNPDGRANSRRTGPGPTEPAQIVYNMQISKGKSAELQR